MAAERHGGSRQKVSVETPCEVEDSARFCGMHAARMDRVFVDEGLDETEIHHSRAQNLIPPNDNSGLKPWTRQFEQRTQKGGSCQAIEPCASHPNRGRSPFVAIVYDIILVVVGLALTLLGGLLTALFVGTAFFLLFRDAVGRLAASYFQELVASNIQSFETKMLVIGLLAGIAAAITWQWVPRSRRLLSVIAACYMTGYTLVEVVYQTSPLALPMPVILPTVFLVGILIGLALIRNKTFDACRYFGGTLYLFIMIVTSAALAVLVGILPAALGVPIPAPLQSQTLLPVFVVGVLIALTLIRKMTLERALMIISSAFGGMLISFVVRKYVVATHHVGPYIVSRGGQYQYSGVGERFSPREQLAIFAGVWLVIARFGSRFQKGMK